MVAAPQYLSCERAPVTWGISPGCLCFGPPHPPLGLGGRTSLCASLSIVTYDGCYNCWCQYKESLRSSERGFQVQQA
eukprot:10335456-Ditylum_brightwellii.AAC.1